MSIDTTSTDALLYGTGVSFPPRVDADGGIAWSNGELNVRECICTILRTRPGERVERPTFGVGLDRYLFEPGTVATLHLIEEEVTKALGRWEPRVTVDNVSVTQNAADPRDVDVTISYTLVATRQRERLAMTVSPTNP